MTCTYYRGEQSFCLRPMQTGSPYCARHTRWYRQRLLDQLVALHVKRRLAELDRELALR